MSGYVVGDAHPSAPKEATVHVITGGWQPEMRDGVVEYLQGLIEKIESGAVTDFVMIYTCDNQYRYRRWTSKLNAVALTAMAHDEALRMMRE